MQTKSNVKELHIKIEYFPCCVHTSMIRVKGLITFDPKDIHTINNLFGSN